MNPILEALATYGGGNPNLQDLRQNRRGVKPPTADDYVNAAKASGSATVGLPGDIESIARLLAQMKSGYIGPEVETTLPTTEDVGEMMNADIDADSFFAGSMFSLDPFSKFMAAAGLIAAPARKILQASDFIGKNANKLKTAAPKFKKAQNAAREAMAKTDKASVDAFDGDSFSGTVFMTPDESAGFSMTDEGYLGHAFNAPNSPYKGVMDAILTRGRAEGANTLEAFDFRRNGNGGSLADAYLKRGAVETERNKWNPDYATDEIIAALGGQQPDFVSMKIGGVFPQYRDSKYLGRPAQNNMPRMTSTPGGILRPATPEIKSAFSQENIDWMNKLVDEGLKEGGGEWYHTAGILDAFIDELGPQQGLKYFNEMEEIGAMLSPKSFPDHETRRASVILKRIKEGKPVHNLDNSMFQNVAPKGHYSDSYGHLATSSAHRGGLNRWLQTGDVGDPANFKKTPSYAQNKKGNFEPYTIDTKDLQGTFMNTPYPNKTTLKEYEYGNMEPLYQDVAKARGMTPAEWQSAKWIGTGKLHHEMGLKEGMSPIQRKSLTELRNQNIAKTAVDYNITEAEAAKRWINREIVLKALLGSVGTGILANSFTSESDERF